MNVYQQKLAKVDIRPSVQRTAIYEYLCKHRVHPTVEMLYSALSPKFPTLSKTTIYNTLKNFVEKKIIKEVAIEDDKLRYDAELRPHLHFKCSSCGKIFDIFDDKKLANYTLHCIDNLPNGFTFFSLEVSLKGLCPDCAKKTANNIN